MIPTMLVYVVPPGSMFYVVPLGQFQSALLLGRAKRYALRRRFVSQHGFALAGWIQQCSFLHYVP